MGVAICGLLSTQPKKCKTVKSIQRASGKVSMSDPILGAAGETNLSITGSDAKIVALQP